MFSAMAIYIACTLLANYFTADFIHLPVFGLVSFGTLFFGVTFTQRDRVHHFGRDKVYAMIAAAAVLNVLMSIFLGVPWRFVLASFLAIILAETADTEVYQRLRKRAWILRVAGSNAISMPLDSTVFTLVAFAGAPGYGLGRLLAIIYGDIAFKFCVGLVAAVRLHWRRRAAEAA